MCTVLFAPSGKNYFFASLRDEDPSRKKAVIPEVYSTNFIKYLSPRDSLAGGTWIGVNTLGHVIILLNGGFVNHEKKETYIKSRGLIVTELLQTTKPITEWDMLNLEDIEPFTLIMWCDSALYELVWDGIKKHRAIPDKNKIHIWSSSTLYDANAKAIRKDKLEIWLKNSEILSPSDTLHFFKSYTDDNIGFIMNRNEKIRTLSFSSIELSDSDSARMNYLDFSTDTLHALTLNLAQNINAC